MILRATHGLFRASRWTPDQLLSFQAERLRKIVQHAVRNVPFYERTFKAAGIDPDKIRSPEDVSRLPIIQKADIQQEPNSFLARGLSSDHLVWYLTSGSTGQPMRVCRSMAEERLLQAYRIRAELLLGMRWTDRRAAVLFTGVPRNQRRIAKPPLSSRLGLLPRTVIQNTDPPAEIIRRLRETRPHVIIGHPSPLARIADAMGDQDRELIKPRFLVTGAETLHTEVRKRIEDAFGARVYDFYGAHECNLVAWQCHRREGYHVAGDNVLVEVLRDGRPVAVGEEGEVVITTLHSYAMPFLRYRLGDIVVKGGLCSCGLPFPTLAKLQGRAADFAYLSDGSKVGAIPLANVFLSRLDWIQQFQMVQTEAGKLSVYIVPHRTPTEREIDATVSEVRARCGLALSHEFVQDLPIRPSGKMPVFVSRVKV